MTLFPLKSFVEGSQDFPSNFESIKKMAEKYKASFEATCIRYAQTHQGKTLLKLIKMKKSLSYLIFSKIKILSIKRFFKS